MFCRILVLDSVPDSPPEHTPDVTPKPEEAPEKKGSITLKESIQGYRLYRGPTMGDPSNPETRDWRTTRLVSGGYGWWAERRETDGVGRMGGTGRVGERIVEVVTGVRGRRYNFEQVQGLGLDHKVWDWSRNGSTEYRVGKDRTYGEVSRWDVSRFHTRGLNRSVWNRVVWTGNGEDYTVSWPTRVSVFPLGNWECPLETPITIIGTKSCVRLFFTSFYCTELVLFRGRGFPVREVLRTVQGVVPWPTDWQG